jgi:hypothetical protein
LKRNDLTKEEREKAANDLEKAARRPCVARVANKTSKWRRS